MTDKTDKATIRDALKETLGTDIGVRMGESLQAALDATKTEWFECRHCFKKTPVTLPNAFERAKACQTVIEQLEGKVGTHREAPAAPKRNVANLEELTDEELLALLQEESDHDADQRQPEPQPQQHEILAPD